MITRTQRPHRAEVQTGGDGRGRGGAGRLTRARRPTRPGLKQAATAGGGPASRSGTAPRGAEVQTGGEGGSGRAPRSPARPARAPGGGGAPAEEAGGPARLAPPGGLIPLCLVCGGDRAEAGAPCAPREHPDYIYQRVVSPQAPTTPSPIHQSGQTGLPERTKATSHPRSASPRVPAPCILTLRAARTLRHRPDQGEPGLSGPDPAQDARPGITGVLSRCAGHPTPPSPCVFAQFREG